MSEISEIEIKSMTKEQNYMRGYEDGKSDVFDKIRADIMKLQTYKMFEGEDTLYVERDDVLAIIDRYKESEDEK